MARRERGAVRRHVLTSAAGQSVMGKLARICRFLADGQRPESSWGQLIEGDFILRECRRAVGRRDALELDQAYRLLSTESAAKHALAMHRQLFKTDRGGERLDILKRIVASAALATCCEHPISHTAIRELTEWAPRAAGCDSQPKPITLSQLETSATLLQRALGDLDGADDACRELALAASRHFAGIEVVVEHSLRIPIAVVDPLSGKAKVVWLYLQKIPGGSGILFPSPLAAVSLEIADDTRDGIQLAWKYASERSDVDQVNVRWWLEGTHSISGRSADAAFAVGMTLLLRDAPYDSCCLISAKLAGDGSLRAVTGIADQGNPKLEAARSILHGPESITFVVSPENQLPAEILAIWQEKGIAVTTCHDVEAAILHAGRRLQQFDDLLRKQVDSVLQRASGRFERTISSVKDFLRLIVPMRIARGIRKPSAESLADESVSGESIDDPNGESGREILLWDEYVDQQRPRTIVLGDPGFGKTSLLWQLVARDCDSARRRLRSDSASLAEATFATFLPAAEIAERLNAGNVPATEAVFVDCIRSLYSLDSNLSELISQKIISGQCCLCIDALDEVTDPRELRRFLRRFLADNGSARLVLSSRLSGYSEAPFDIDPDDQVEILPLVTDQIRQAIDSWFGDEPEVAKTIWRQIGRNDRLHDAFASPLLLHLATRQIRMAREADRELPKWERRVDLYHGFVDHALQQLAERSEEPIKEMESLELRLFLGEFALALWQHDSARTLWSRDQLRIQIKSTVQQGQFWGLQKRFHQLFDDLQDSGILVPVTAGDSNSPMMFLHRTIGEFLAGERIATSINESKDQCWELVEKKSWDPNWEQVILFVAGCLKEPSDLLGRLINGSPTQLNPYGDDLLRHRLLLAAKSIREMDVTSGDFARGDVASGIGVSVIELLRQIPGLLELPEVSNALQALATVDEATDAGSFVRSIRERLPNAEQAISLMGQAAYSEQTYQWLADSLCGACQSERPGHVNRPLAPIATALIEISDDIDLQRLSKPLINDGAARWRVIGSLLRAAKHRAVDSVRIDAAFLDSIADALFIPNPGIGLRQTIDALPPVSEQTLRESKLVECCCIAIAPRQPSETQTLAFRLLKSLGPAAGKSPALSAQISSLEFDGQRRIVLEAVQAIRTSLATAEFVSALISSIEAASPQAAELGIEVYFSIDAHHLPEWLDGIERLVARFQFAGRRFGQHLRNHPSHSLIDQASRWMKTESLRLAALQAMKGCVESLQGDESTSNPPRLGQRLRWLDRLVTSSIRRDGAGTFDDPQVLNQVQAASEFSIHILFVPLVRLAFRHRSSDRLVDWVIDQLAENVATGAGNFTLLSESLFLLSASQKKYLRFAAKEAGLAGSAKCYLGFAEIVCDHAQERLECVFQYLESSGTSQHGTAARILGDAPAGAVDQRFTPYILKMLGDPRPSRRLPAIHAIKGLANSVMTPDLAERLLSALERETKPGDLTKAVAVLASRNQDCFAGRLWQLYFDEESLLQEHAALILPHLGSRLVDSERFAPLCSLLRSENRSRRIETARILCRTMQFCDNSHRAKLLRALSTIKDESLFSRLRAFDIPDEGLAGWIFEQLEHEESQVVQTAMRLLLQTIANLSTKAQNVSTKAQGESLVSRVATSGLNAVRIRLPMEIASPHRRTIEQLALELQRRQYRLFCGDQTIDGEAVVRLSV